MKELLKKTPIYRVYLFLFSINKKYIKTTQAWMHIQYIVGYLCNILALYIIYIRGKKKHVRAKTHTKKRVLIVYSESHFNPLHDSSVHENSQSSAGNIARNIYQALEGSEIEYIHHSGNRRVITPVDVVIGIVSENFLYYAKQNPNAQIILFLVNAHPLFRLHTLLKESSALKKKLPFSEYLSPYIFLRCMLYSDTLLLIGNDFVAHTYAQYGIAREKIFLLNSGVNSNILTPEKNARPQNTFRVIYVASHMGIRKGLFRVMEVWEEILKQDHAHRIELYILGTVDPLFENDFNAFISQYPSVTYLGWIDSSTQKYKNILASCHCILYPSLEEGQVGTVLEAMSTGAIPVATKASGIEFSQREGFLIEHHTDSIRMAEIITSLSQNPEKTKTLSIQSRKYVEQNHLWQTFQNTIRSLILPEKREVHPLTHIDIVLSIYNQEKLIERVLYGIFKHTTTPFSLILVFDGCTDRTKPRVLRYIERYRPVYLKHIISQDTSNIFETKANNVGYKLVTSDYFLNLQDDVVIQETGWERRLTYPLRMRDDVFGVTGRIAEDFREVTETYHSYMNERGRELGNLPRNIFAIRDRLNRGPIAWKTASIKAMGYYNEEYAPSDLDDADLCLRAWNTHAWKVGVFSIRFLSRLEWGKSRDKDSQMDAMKNISRNQGRLGRDHREYIDSGIKHDEDICIDEDEIDYVKHPTLPRYFHYPVRYNTYHIRKYLESKIPGLSKVTNFFLNTIHY